MFFYFVFSDIIKSKRITQGIPCKSGVTDATVRGECKIHEIKVIRGISEEAPESSRGKFRGWRNRRRNRSEREPGNVITTYTEDPASAEIPDGTGLIFRMGKQVLSVVKASQIFEVSVIQLSPGVFRIKVRYDPRERPDPKERPEPEERPEQS